MTTIDIATVQQRRVGCTDAATLQGVLSELLRQIETHRAALRVEYWKRGKGCRQPHQWHVVSVSNGEILAGGESYTRKDKMMRTINGLFPGVEAREICAPGSITTKGGTKV
jgi:hypothetical protein